MLGGFPEPYLAGSEAKARRWRRTHTDVIIREELLDLEKVRDIKSIEILIDLIRTRVGLPISYNSLANDLQVSVPTVKHWLQILENLYVIFAVRPYSKNIARSILKESKYYLHDTGAVEGDIGARLENTVACALLRELHFIEDTTGSKVALHYVRDKEKREVDFLAVIDGKPMLLVEVKSSDDVLSPVLTRFRNYLGMVKTVQVVYKLKRKMEKDGIRIVHAAEFLAGLEIAQDA
jgi:predicted AAA+ superfamily ATPase